MPRCGLPTLSRQTYRRWWSSRQRLTLLSKSGTELPLNISRQSRERERERDGYPSSDSSTSDSTVESEPGKFTDSLCCEEHGVTLISKFKPSTSFAKRTYERWFYRVPARQAQNSQIEGTIVGFPYQQRPWCNSKLKTKALQQPFYQAPLHKELTQILCNISGLLQTSRKESSDILDPV